MTTSTNTCRCGGSFDPVDRDESSTTVRCLSCHHCSLVVVRPHGHRVIFLSDFHLKRGDRPDQRPLDDLDMATRLVRCLVDDEWPTPATIVDYGIQSQHHLSALQHAVRCGCRAYDLDRVMGDGPAITELVNAFPGQPYGSVEFNTPCLFILSM